MSHVPASALAEQAEKHLGEPGPRNTCVSNGPERWTHELGLPTLGTDSVTEYVKRAKAGQYGYRYHDGTDGLSRGHIGVWTHEALGSDDDEHVSVVVEVQGPMQRSIGSGTPNGTVNTQPRGGGLNPRRFLRGYVIAPTETAAAAAAPAAAKPAPSSSSKGKPYVVQQGDYLARIARQHHTSVKAILALNPALPSRKSADFHIARANLIIAGQRIHLP